MRRFSTSSQALRSAWQPSSCASVSAIAASIAEVHPESVTQNKDLGAEMQITAPVPKYEASTWPRDKYPVVCWFLSRWDTERSRDRRTTCMYSIVRSTFANSWPWASFHTCEPKHGSESSAPPCLLGPSPYLSHTNTLNPKIPAPASDSPTGPLAGAFIATASSNGMGQQISDGAGVPQQTREQCLCCQGVSRVLSSVSSVVTHRRSLPRATAP